MKIEIKTPAGIVLFETEAVDMKSAVQFAIKAKADLSSANLRSADLRSADLRYADLRYADLSSADLRYANLSYANLSSADLRYADLSSADLSSLKVFNWQSHELIAQVLFQKSGDNIERRKIAGLILISKDWCWDQLFKIESPERSWAIELLKSQNPEGMPNVLKEAK